MPFKQPVFHGTYEFFYLPHIFWLGLTPRIHTPDRIGCFGFQSHPKIVGFSIIPSEKDIPGFLGQHGKSPIITTIWGDFGENIFWRFFPSTVHMQIQDHITTWPLWTKHWLLRVYRVFYYAVMWGLLQTITSWFKHTFSGWLSAPFKVWWPPTSG